MELVIMFGIVFFFGTVILSTVAQRGSQAPAPILFVRAEPVERLPASDAGISLVILMLVIAAAVWLF
jgi:hypothetical protein